jgi:tellurite resistance protein
MEFFKEVEMTQTEAEAMVRGFVAMARADGEVHQREMALVHGFYGALVEAQPSALAALEKSPDIEPASLASILKTPSLRQLFLKTCVLLGHADGDYSAKEKQLVSRFAQAFGIGKKDLEGLEQNVKEYLLGHLSGVRNVESTAKVANKLGA